MSYFLFKNDLNCVLLLLLLLFYFFIYLDVYFPLQMDKNWNDW